jgi:hypothetical protein
VNAPLDGGKECDVTGKAPDTLYVLLRDEEAAGRVVVELGAFVRFSRKFDKQLARLERQMLQRYPKLRKRGRQGQRQRGDAGGLRGA